MVFVNEALTKDANAFDRVWMDAPMHPHHKAKLVEADIREYRVAGRMQRLIACETRLGIR